MPYARAVDFNSDQGKCLIWNADLQISGHYHFLFIRQN